VKRHLVGLTIVIILVVVVLVLINSYATTGFMVLNNEKTIKIGFVGALTTDYASYGINEKNAIELALSEINSNGGILGKQVEVIYEDGRCNGKEAVSAVNKLINVDGVKIVLGGSCSGETLAMAPIVEENKVLLFSAFSSNSDITNAGDYVFRNCPTDFDGATQIAKLIIDKNNKKIALISENTDFAQGVRKIFSKTVKELGGEIVADEIYGQNGRDFKTQLTKIKQASPEVIFFNAQTDVSGGLAVKQAKELGINAQYFGYFVFSSKNALGNAGEAANGMIFADVPSLSTGEKAKTFLEKYFKHYGSSVSEFGAGARYDSVYILKEAIESCGKVDVDCIKEYLYSLESYSGTIGEYNFDAQGDVVGIEWALKKVIDAKNGKVIIVVK